VWCQRQGLCLQLQGHRDQASPGAAESAVQTTLTQSLRGVALLFMLQGVTHTQVNMDIQDYTLITEVLLEQGHDPLMSSLFCCHVPPGHCCAPPPSHSPAPMISPHPSPPPTLTRPSAGSPWSCPAPPRLPGPSR
jgi:hypothetical protein